MRTGPLSIFLLSLSLSPLLPHSFVGIGRSPRRNEPPVRSPALGQRASSVSLSTTGSRRHRARSFAIRIADELDSSESARECLAPVEKTRRPARLPRTASLINTMPASRLRSFTLLAAFPSHRAAKAARQRPFRALSGARPPETLPTSIITISLLSRSLPPSRLFTSLPSFPS